MTTICYSANEIAFDSRTTHGETILTDKSKKRHSRGGREFFLSGTATDEIRFIECFDDPEKGQNLDVTAIVWDGETLFLCGSSENGIWKYPNDLSIPIAIGSGARFAMGAIQAGQTAREAVASAKALDPYTGGRIRTFKIARKV